jgi:hypothetical protein
MIVFKSLGGGTDGPTIILTIVDGKVVIKASAGVDPGRASPRSRRPCLPSRTPARSRARRRALGFEAVAHEVLQARVGEIQEYMGAEQA